MILTIMKINRINLVFLLTLISLTGCGTTDGVGRYRVATIGNAKRSIDAIIISSNSTLVQTNSTGVGAIAGGTAGGVAAALNSNNAAVIVAGIVGGVLIGGAIEGWENVHEATEYVIQTSTSAIFTVVQINKNNPIFHPKDKVILVYGYPSKLIKDQR